MRNVLTVKPDLTAARLHNTSNHHEHRRLAAARRSKNAREAALRQAQRTGSNGRRPVIAFRKFVDFES